MRLDFNVLWVDDQPNNVSDQRERIATLIRREGFRLQVEFATSVDQATGYLEDDIYGDHIDLVLMDLDLGAGRNGAQGLSEVREKFPFKDLIFYSANDPARLAQMVKDRNIEGVFTAYRLDLPDIVKGVFDNLVRKVLDIDHSRGIIMGATSDVDKTILAGLASVFDGCDNDQKASAIDAIQSRLVEKRKGFEETVAAIEEITHVRQLEGHHTVYTSDDRFRLLQKLLKQQKLYEKHRNSFDQYRKTVMPQRNDLAHIHIQKEGFSRKFFDREGKEFSSDDMQALRVALLEFQEILDEIFPPRAA